MQNKLSIEEFFELDEKKKSDYLNEFTVWDGDEPIFKVLKKKFIEEHGKTGRLEEVTASAGDGVYPATLVVRVNRKSGKTRIPSDYHGLWVRKWYAYEPKNKNRL